MKLLLPLLLSATLYAQAQKNSTPNWLDLMHLGLLKTNSISGSEDSGNRITNNVQKERSVKIGGNFNKQSIGCTGSECNATNVVTRGSNNIRLPRLGVKPENQPLNSKVSAPDFQLDLKKNLDAEAPDNAADDTPAL